MAKKGTSKRRSTDQEDYIASLYSGRRSPSSGAAENDAGDVRSESQIFECKCKGGVEYDSARTNQGKAPQRTTLLQRFEKISQEAWAEGRTPVLAIREWAPESPLAGPNGWVDIVVRSAHEDYEKWR